METVWGEGKRENGREMKKSNRQREKHPGPRKVGRRSMMRGCSLTTQIGTKSKEMRKT